VVVTNEVTILLANLSVTSDKKVEQTEQTGQTTTMTTSNPKTTKKDESLMPSMMMEVGTEIERDYELLEFDDCSEVDYDLDYTVQY
jgi:hypothetical protein